jgi:hypothetical protein
MILQVNTEQVTHEQQIAVEIEEEQKEAELEVKDEEIHNTCAVCLDTLQDELAACPCGHVFHWSCIKVALKSFPRCPVCCQTTRTYRVVKLYLGKKGNHLGGTMTIPKVCHPKALQGLTKAKEECEALMIRLRENSLYRIKYEHSKSILDKTESSNHVLSRRVNFLQKNLDETIQEKELMTNKFQIEKEKNQRIKNDLKSWKRRGINNKTS